MRPADRQTLTTAYEELRRQAVDHSSSQSLGMALLLGQGMVVWIEACSSAPSTPPHNMRLLPADAVPLPHDLRGEIVVVLAAMALGQASEVHP